MFSLFFRYEATLDPWMLSLWGTLYQINPKYFPKGPDVVIPRDELIDQPKYRIVYHKQETLEPALMVESGTPSFIPIMLLRREFIVWILCFIRVSLGLCYALLHRVLYV